MADRVPFEARLLCLGLFLSIASSNMITPLLPQIRESMGMSVAAIGAYVSAFGLARLIVDLPSGALQVRIGPRRMASAGMLLNAMSSALAAVAPTAAVLLLARVGAGLGAALIATVVLTALSEVAPGHIRGRVMSLYQVGNNLGIAIYPLIGGGIGILLGWRAAFVAAALTAVVSGLVLGPVLSRVERLNAVDPVDLADMVTPVRDVSPANSLADAPTTAGPTGHRLLWLALAVVFVGVVANMINRHGFRNTLLPLVASSRLGLDELQIAAGITAMSLTGILVTVPAATLGDRYGRRRVIVAGLVALAVGDAVFPMVAKGVASYLVAGAIIGLGDCFASSQTALLAEMVDWRQRSMALAGYRFFVDLGALAGPFGLAWVLDRYGATTAIWTAATVLIVAAGVTVAGGYRRLQPQPAQRQPD